VSTSEYLAERGRRRITGGDKHLAAELIAGGHGRATVRQHGGSLGVAARRSGMALACCTEPEPAFRLLRGSI